jgi:hypothetical protein
MSTERDALVRMHRRYQAVVAVGVLMAAAMTVGTLASGLLVGATLCGVATVASFVALVRGFPGYHRALDELSKRS